MACIGAAVVILVLVGLYTQRGPIGARLATAYLRGRGVPATIVVDRLDPDGFVGSAVLGDPRDPDLTVRRVEVEFEAIPLLKSGLVAPRLRAIRLVAPQLKARWDGKALDFGSLQPLVEEAGRAPAAGPGPSIAIEQGRLQLATPAGALRIDGDGRVESGRLVTLTARVHPAALRRGQLALQVAGATLRASTRGEVIVAVAHLDLARASQAASVAEAVSADATGQIPYTAGPRLDGPISLDAKVAAARLAAGATAVAQPRLSLSLAGLAGGTVDALAIKGSGTGAFTAASVHTATGDAGRVEVAGRLVGLEFAWVPGGGLRLAFGGDLTGVLGRLTAPGLVATDARLKLAVSKAEGEVGASGGRLAFTPAVAASAPRALASGLTLKGAALEMASPMAALAWGKMGWSFTGPVRARIGAAALAQPVLAGDLSLSDVAVAVSGPLTVGSARARFDLGGSAQSRGGALSPAAARAVAAALPVIGSDAAGQAAILAAFRTARLDAPAFRVRADDGGVSVALPRPVRLVGRDGAAASLAARGDAPIMHGAWSAWTGGLAFQLDGPGLPRIDADLPAYRAGLDRGGLTLQADARLGLAFTGATLRGLSVAAPVHLTRREGVLTAALTDCAPVAAAAFGDPAAPLLTKTDARLCAQDDQPLLSLTPSRWRLRARIDDAQADAPASEALIRAGRVAIDLDGTGSRPPVGVARIDAARVLDGAAMKRFEPLAVTGRIALADDVWTGPVDVATAAKGRPLARLQVSHVMASGVGGADIAAPALRFAKDGLQPLELSPLAGALATEAEGAVAFTGRADWSAAGGVVSRGRLTTTGVDFRSPFGLVKHALATLDFTSLAPLVTAPGQPVSADAIAALVPLTQVSARIALREDRMVIDQAKAELSGGQAVLDPLELAYAPGSPLSGVVRLTQIDLGALVRQFNLADKVAIDARIDGTIPFALANGALNLDKGHVFATGPGRLSIKREALTGASASVSASAPPGAPAPAAVTGGVQDIAYQALENLAVDKLEADLASQPGGRLGILFKINGRNDPPNGGETRVGLFDLLRGKAFDKPLTLPKGTPVNLTLDSSLNFDELLAAYTNRGRSEQVQPPAPTNGPAKE